MFPFVSAVKSYKLIDLRRIQRLTISIWHQTTFGIFHLDKKYPKRGSKIIYRFSQNISYKILVAEEFFVIRSCRAKLCSITIVNNN
jgi:hypothetical protein